MSLARVRRDALDHGADGNFKASYSDYSEVTFGPGQVGALNDSALYNLSLMKNSKAKLSLGMIQ